MTGNQEHFSLNGAGPSLVGDLASSWTPVASSPGHGKFIMSFFGATIVSYNHDEMSLMMSFNRPGVSGAVLQTPVSFIN